MRYIYKEKMNALWIRILTFRIRGNFMMEKRTKTGRRLTLPPHCKHSKREICHIHIYK